ncbi:MAG TPA: MarR family transcriptional regulator [Burkholderiaceae bacterium]|nr:MarR family transcriptional regulator [Burkholderiaceae bacterium]
MYHHLEHPRVIGDLLLYRINRLLSAGGAPIIRLCEGRFGITRREWRVLAALAQYKNLLSSELADCAQLDRSRTSKAITTLVQKKLLQRKILSSDRRKAQLALTESGYALYDGMFPQVLKIHAELIGGLTAAEVMQLDMLLEKLQEQAEIMQLAHDWPKANRGRHA